MGDHLAMVCFTSIIRSVQLLGIKSKTRELSIVRIIACQRNRHASKVTKRLADQCRSLETYAISSSVFLLTFSRLLYRGNTKMTIFVIKNTFFISLGFSASATLVLFMCHVSLGHRPQ